MHRAALLYVSPYSLVYVVRKACRFHGDVVEGDGHKRGRKFACVISRSLAHDELRVAVGDCHGSACDSGAVGIFYGADNRTGYFLGGRDSGQAEENSDCYKHNAQKLKLMSH